MQWLGRVCFYKRWWYLPDELLEVVQEFKDSIPNWDHWYEVSDIEVYAFQIDIHTLAEKYSIFQSLHAMQVEDERFCVWSVRRTNNHKLSGKSDDSSTSSTDFHPPGLSQT